MLHGVGHGVLCGGGAARAPSWRAAAARSSAQHAGAAPAPRCCHAGGGTRGGDNGGHSSGGGGGGGGGGEDDSSHRFRHHRAAALAAAAAALFLSAPRAARAGLLPPDFKPSLGSSSGGDGADDSDTERLRRLMRASFRELLDARRRLRALEEHSGLLGALAAKRVDGGSKSSGGSGSALRFSGRLSGAAGAALPATHVHAALRRAGVASVRAHTHPYHTPCAHVCVHACCLLRAASCA
jgi:hypothetical protein